MPILRCFIMICNYSLKIQIGFCSFTLQQPIYSLSQIIKTYPYIFSHTYIAESIGRIDSPKSVSAYSTFGGTSGNTVRDIIPSDSSWRRLSVNTFWLTPVSDFLNSLNLQGLTRKLRSIYYILGFLYRWSCILVGFQIEIIPPIACLCTNYHDFIQIWFQTA